MKTLSPLLLLLSLLLGGYVLAQWFRMPELTEMQMFLRFWPYLLIAAVLVLAAGLTKR